MPKKALLYGFIGDFGGWYIVPYLVEDIENGNRKPYMAPGDCFYISPSTLLALAIHVILQAKPESMDIVLYAPSSLITSRTALKYNNLREYYEKLCGDTTTEYSLIRLADFGKAFADAFAHKLKESVDAIEEKMEGIDDNKRECLNRQRSILNTFEKLLRDIAKRESNYEAEAEIKNTHVKISVVPLPMALTYVCDNKTRIVTYRFSNAADRLTALLIVNMAYHILDKLYSIERSNYRPSGSGIGDGYNSLLVAIDLSHGVNYSSASLLQAYNSLSRWVGSLLDSRFGESGIRVEFKLYNSDPVKGGLDIASSEAYKIHLVSHIGLEASKLPQGYTQATVASILEEILKAGLNASNLENNIKSILKTIIKENVNISNLQNASEHYELWLASTSLGLALWSIYFAERFAAELKDADLNDPLKVLSRLSRLWNSLQLEINPQKNKNLVNINVKATEDNDIILSMLHTPEALLLLLFALSIVLREGVKRELEKGCINLESYSSNFKVDNTNVHGVLVYSARDQDECDIRNYIRSLFNWLTHQSLAILEEEIIKEEKADEKKYGYMPGQIKERHLLAHAGLARGAAVLLEYAPARVGETGSVVILKRALLFDTDSLRSTLKKLAFERR